MSCSNELSNIFSQRFILFSDIMTSNHIKIGTIINASDIKVAVRNAKKLNPLVRRLYIDVEDNGSIEFISRIRDSNNQIQDITVHRTEVILNSIDRNDKSFRYNGHAMCISIEKYDKLDTKYNGSLIVSTNDSMDVSCNIRK